MNKLITTHIGGFPLFTDDFKFTDKAYRDAFVALVSHLDYTTILSGCQRTQNGLNVSVTEGYIALSGEILHLPHQSYTLQNANDFEYFALDVSFDANGLKEFENNIQYNTYQVRKAKVVISGSPVPNKTRIQQVRTIYQVFEHNMPQIGINTIESAKQSTETQRGHIILATQAETNNGADDSKAITPKKLWNNPLIPKIYHKSRVYLGTMIGSDLFTINMPNIGTTNYLVLGTLRWYSSNFNSGQAWSALANSTFLVWSLGSQQTDSFSIVVKDIRPTPTTAKVFFDYVLIKY